MPEKNANEIPRPLREQYEKGRLAFDKNNLDFAISLLSQVLEQEPAFFECRQALRATQFKKSGGAGKGFFKRLIGATNPKVIQARMALRGNPVETLNLAEQVLNGDPANLDAHRLLADAALALDLPKTATLSLEIILKQAPGDRDTAIKLAETFAATGQGARGESIMSELLRLHPNDPDIAKRLKNLSARRTLSEGGYNALADGQGSYRDILRNEKEAVGIEQEHREQKSGDDLGALLAEQQKRLADEPDNLRLVRSIAELHAQRHEFDEALHHYRRIQGTEAADPSLERAIAAIEARKFDQTIGGLDVSAPDHAEQTAKLTADKAEFLLTDCLSRVERYPNDLLLRFELGELYFAAGRVGEAIAEFQKAQHNPSKRIAALYYLGRCFGRRGMHDLAVRTLQAALKEKPVFDDEKKELIYALGCAFEKMGRAEDAIEQFKHIYETDIAFKDVGVKVDAYYASKNIV